MIIVGAVIILVLLMISGIPIPLSFLGSSMFIVVAGGYDYSFLFPYGFTKLNSILLLTIPLFILAGAVMDKGGIGAKLIGLVQKFAGKKKGVQGVITVVSCAVFGSISGSASATITCIGSIMAPRMEENGYDRGFIGALISSAGLLGLLIPPSATMILFAWVGNQSVLACFLSTVIPGLILVVLFSLVNLSYAKKNPNIKTYTAPLVPQKKKGNSAVPAILMPIIILGSIYGGILTPTESAAISVVYAIPVGIFYYKTIKKKELKEALITAAKTSGVVMVMLFAVQILSRLYIMERLPQMILDLLYSISTNPTIILIMVNIFMIIVGMLMDDVSGVLLCTPLLLPIVTQIGINPIHFAAIVGVNLGLGSITPPTAPMLYLGGRVANAEVKDMLGPTWKLIIYAWIPTLIVTTYIPDLALMLPRLMGYVQ